MKRDIIYPVIGALALANVLLLSYALYLERQTTRIEVNLTGSAFSAEQR